MLIKLFSILWCHHVLKLKSFPWNFEIQKWTQCDYLCTASKYEETDFFHCVPFLWKFNIVDEFYLQIFQSQEMIPQVECAIYIQIQCWIPNNFVHKRNSMHCFSSKQYLRLIILFCSFYDWTIQKLWVFWSSHLLLLFAVRYMDSIGKPIKQKQKKREKI